MAVFCARHTEIRILAAPLKAPTLQVHQFWHRHFHKNPRNEWLRGALHALFGA